LIPGQSLQFGNLGAIGVQSAQIGQLRTAMFGQQIRINLIGFGSGGHPEAHNGFRIDRIEGNARFQQGRDEQPMLGFQNTGDLIERREVSQEANQFVQARCGVLNPQRGDFATSFVDDDHIMLGIGPVNAYIPHDKLLWDRFFLEQVLSLSLAVEPRSSNHPFGEGNRRRRSSFSLYWSSQMEKRRFRLAVLCNQCINRLRL
jgi:hypothetical protein